MHLYICIRCVVTYGSTGTLILGTSKSRSVWSRTNNMKQRSAGCRPVACRPGYFTCWPFFRLFPSFSLFVPSSLFISSPWYKWAATRDDPKPRRARNDLFIYLKKNGERKKIFFYIWVDSFSTPPCPVNVGMAIYQATLHISHATLIRLSTFFISPALWYTLNRSVTAVQYRPSATSTVSTGICVRVDHRVLMQSSCVWACHVPHMKLDMRKVLRNVQLLGTQWRN